MDIEGAFTFPIIWNDPLNIGRILCELRLQCHPSQKFIYCTKASQSELKNFKNIGMDRVRYSPNKPMGVNTLGDMLKNFCKAAGIVKWDSKTPHCLRQYFITKMANDPTLNPHEIAKLARHKSVTSQEAYVRRNRTAQVNCAIALARPGSGNHHGGSLAHVFDAPQAFFPSSANQALANMLRMPMPAFNPPRAIVQQAASGIASEQVAYNQLRQQAFQQVRGELPPNHQMLLANRPFIQESLIQDVVAEEMANEEPGDNSV